MADPTGRDPSAEEDLADARRRWEATTRARTTDRKPSFKSLSGDPIQDVYTPLDRPGSAYARDLGMPGEYPYTRGIHANMYRGRMFTMRQFAGFGTARQTNERFRFLLDQGQTGLSVAFDMPTLMGYDSDHPRSLGEVGREGVAIDTLADMEALFEGIPLDAVSTSMTINGPAPILWAMYLVVAERQGVPWSRLRGTTQADILKEFIAQKEWIIPPRPSVDVLADTLAFAAQHVPQWYPVSISGYHIREAGSTAAQELAFTLADGFAYLDAGVRAGLDVDTFAPRLSFFFNAHIDFFEEIAKFRAARRIWARHLRERYGAKDPRSWMLRFHTQTAGCSLTAQQPMNNVVRTAVEALSAILGGTQSLHTNSLDEVLALPSQSAAKLALRTQQILAVETGVTDTVDPLGGSYYVEALTDRIEAQAEAYFREIDAMGGVVAGIDNGYFQREIAEAAFRYQSDVDAGERLVVGVNAYVDADDGGDLEILRVDPAVEVEQIQRVAQVRAQRDERGVRTALDGLEGAAREGRNVMEPILDAVRAYATEGEIVASLQAVHGRYRETSVF